MKILDCETQETMYASLEQITGVTKAELLSFFNQFDLEKYYEDNPDYWEPAEDLFLNKLRAMARTNLQFDCTTWFHLTRTFKGNDFKDGILPLGKNVQFIWDFLFHLQKGFLSQEEWQNFKKYVEKQSSGHYAWLYRMKVSDSFHWGPYAMLIKDVAFSAEEIGNHDYLDAPEIVEDICFTFEEKYNYDLLTKFKQSTYPCIIKFQVQESNIRHLGIVLNFLYHKHQNMELSIHCNTCFDANGTTIPKEAIMKIEYI